MLSATATARSRRRRTSPPDSGPNELTLGDFNGDGQLDIAVANQNANDASVLLNQSLQCALGQQFSGVVATFTDANPFGSPVDFSATINWGDGTTSTADFMDQTLIQNADGSFSAIGTHVYTEAQAYDISVTIQDSGGSTTVATNTITVTPTPPVAVNAFYQTIQGQGLTENAANGVLASDYDYDGNPLAVRPGTFSTAEGGSVVINADGSFTYTPAAGFAGTDEFVYTMLDEGEPQKPVQGDVFIAVQAVAPPVKLVAISAVVPSTPPISPPGQPWPNGDYRV